MLFGSDVMKKKSLEIMEKRKGQFLSIEHSYQLRGLAMIMIILSHLSQHLWEEYNSGITFLIQGGSMGNSIFLFMSGYGMYMSMTKQEKLKVRYLWQHIIKIIVPFIFAFIISLLGIVVMSDKYNWTNVFSDLFTMTLPYTREWFLKAIIMLYIFSFIAFKLSSKPYGRVVLVAIFSLIYCVIGYYVGIGKWMYETILNYAAGMLIAIMQIKMNQANWRITFGSFLVLFVMLFGIYLKCPIPFVNRFLYGFCLTITLIYAFKIFSRQSNILRFVGINSILFYLFHIAFLHVHYSPYIDMIIIIIATISLTLIYISFKKYIDQFIISIS